MFSLEAGGLARQSHKQSMCFSKAKQLLLNAKTIRLERDQYSYTGLCSYKGKHSNLMKQTSYYILSGACGCACVIDPAATCCSVDPIKSPCKAIISILFSDHEDIRHVRTIDSRKYCDIQHIWYCENIAITPGLHLAPLELQRYRVTFGRTVMRTIQKVTRLKKINGTDKVLEQNWII